MNITRNISTLTNWDKNPRSIKDKDFNRLKKQIKELGQYKPLLITEDGVVLGGNMRLRAYKDLGLKDIWVSVVDAPTEEKKLEYALSDNDRAGYYDSDLLANIMPEYPEFNWQDYAVDLVEPKTIDQLIQIDEVEEDEAPPVAEGEAESKLGEVYQLGRHRLMCGDATKIEDVEKLMDGQKAEILFTSPPYADMREYNGGKELSTEYLATFIPTFRMFASYQVINLGIQRKDGEINQYWDDYIASAKNAGLKLLSWNIWNREGTGFTMAQITAMFAIQHEWIFVFGENLKDLNLTVPNKDAGEFNDHSGVRQADGSVTKSKDMTIRSHRQLGTVNTINSEQSREWTGEHSAMFPVRLPTEYIKAMTNDGDNVIDCFGGSGSTLIAAEQTNRTCYMMELDPKYCDVIRKRYDNFIQNNNKQ